ncbi:hypothetical protein RB202_12235 [Micrococcus yunnanensis]|uniref:hypothetical protein n=1 Tax=Micrococcus TaxID=1269 RepID=UPI0030154796
MLFNTKLFGCVNPRNTIFAKLQELRFPFVRVVTGEDAGAMRPRIPSHPVDAELACHF